MNQPPSSFIGHALKSSIHGIKGIYYPLWIECVISAFRWGIAFIVLLFIQYKITGNSDVLNQNTIWLWSVFIGFPIIAWWVFTSACKVAWWRHFESASNQTESRGPWINDLPVMMGINLVFGLLKGGCYLAFGLCAYFIFFKNAASAVVLMAFSLLVLLICNILHPAVTAQRMISGPGLLRAFAKAATKVICHPLKTLAVRFIPQMAMACLWGVACIEMVMDKPLFAAFFLTVSVFIPLIYPVFWIELMRDREQCELNS